jgi:ribosome-associated heat shock protein Hsp15
MSSSEAAFESVRLDVWLDVACLFPTRSQAKAACDMGRVDVNGSRGKPHREIRVGDRLTVTRAGGEPRELLVKAIAAHSIPKGQARKLYEDRTPSPSPQVVEARRLDRLLAPKVESGRPDKRERRARIRHKRS